MCRVNICLFILLHLLLFLSFFFWFYYNCYFILFIFSGRNYCWISPHSDRYNNALSQSCINFVQFDLYFWDVQDEMELLKRFDVMGTASVSVDTIFFRSIFCCKLNRIGCGWIRVCPGRTFASQNRCSIFYLDFRNAYSSNLMIIYVTKIIRIIVKFSQY